MSDQAQRRIQAVGRQLTSGSGRVHGKVVLITGANSPHGIGRASAVQFAANGARAVYMCDFDGTHLDAHKKELNASFPDVEVHTWRFDAADGAGVKAVVDDAVERYGRLDVFFANAGISGGLPNSFTEISDENFMSVMKTNSLSVFLAAKYAAPAMKKTSADKPKANGSIIATASVAGLRSNAGPTPYSASKAAVISIVQTIAFQLVDTDIRINAICPGLIETGMTAPLYKAARARGVEKNIGQLNPMNRGGEPDEIARVALFLGSDDSSYVNGQAWAVDGGLSAGLPFIRGKMS